MCTAPQNFFIPESGVKTPEGVVSFDKNIISATKLSDPADVYFTTSNYIFRILSEGDLKRKYKIILFIDEIDNNDIYNKLIYNIVTQRLIQHSIFRIVLNGGVNFFNTVPMYEPTLNKINLTYANNVSYFGHD